MTRQAQESLPVYLATIDPAWIDYNGHLRDAYYGLIVSYAVDAAMDRFGLDAAYRDRTKCTLFTLEMHIHYLHEVKGTDCVEVTTVVLDADHKRVHVGCRFTSANTEGTLATADLMLMHVQQGVIPKGIHFPVEVAARLDAMRLGAAAAAAWQPRSRRIEIKRRPPA